MNVQRDLEQLIDWADARAVRRQGLGAGPTRLDDVLRIIDAESARRVTAAPPPTEGDSSCSPSRTAS